MEDIDILLSNKYVEFAKQIIGLSDEKDKLQIALCYTQRMTTDKYNELVNKLYALRNQAKEAQDEFEAWKKECLNNIGDG